jgi:hypothetical protein
MSRATPLIAARLATWRTCLNGDHVNQLTTYAMAGADGMFIANEIGGDAVDLVALFELHPGRGRHRPSTDRA